MIQIYADRRDMIYSEEKEKDNGFFHELMDDIYRKGFTNSLHCKPDGYLLRGNTRTEVAERLNIKYLPINLKALLGLFVNSDGSEIRIRTSVIDYYLNSGDTPDADYRLNHPVIPNKDKTRMRLSDPIEYDDDYSYYKLVRRVSNG